MVDDPRPLPGAAEAIAALRAQQAQSQQGSIPDSKKTAKQRRLDADPSLDPLAPWGRTKDGKAKRKPGRKRVHPVGKRASRSQRRKNKGITGRVLDKVEKTPPGSKTNIDSPDSNPQLREKIAPYSMFGQNALDELTALGPSQSLKFLAEKIMPSQVNFGSGGVQTYEQWIMSELPEIFTVPLGPHQIWPCEHLRAVPNGLRLAEAAPRGSGKTKFLFQGLPLACIAIGTHQLIPLVGSTQTEASSRLNDIRSLLNRRPDLAEKYPRLRYVMAPRSTKRYKTDTNIEIELEGGKIIAVGAESKIRGIGRDLASGESLRPDLALIDDFETAEQVRSKIRTDRLEEWIFAEICQLGTTQKPVSVILSGTTLGADAVLVHAMKHQGRFESWTTKSFPIVYEGEDGEKRRMWPDYYSWESIKALLDPKSSLYVGPFTYSREFLLNPTDVVGAIWTEGDIREARLDLPEGESLPEFRRVVVAVDPSWGTTRDECGIIVAALGVDGVCYVLADLSGRMAPSDWGRTSAQAFVDYRANQFVAEAVFGGEDVKVVMDNSSPKVPVTLVTTTIRKRNRFEEIYKLFKQLRVRLVGSHPLLEHQMGDWVEDQSQYSPDRLDAMCYAVAHLMLKPAYRAARVFRPQKVLEDQQLVIGQGNDRVVLGRARVR